MIELFDKRFYPINNIPAIYTGETDNVVNNIRYNLERVQAYYNNITARQARADHILARLIGSVGIPMSYDLEVQIRLAEQRGIAVATALNLTTFNGKGQSVSSQFTQLSHEYLFVYAGSWYPDALPTLADMKPIQFLYHPYGDLQAPIFGDKVLQPKPGYCVITVDIVALWLMYYQWYTSRKEEDSKDVWHFITKWVLPSAIESFTDISLFHRLVGNPVITSGVTHPFHLLDVERRVGRVATLYKTGLPTKRLMLEQALRSLPSVTNNTLFDSLLLPPLTSNANTRWLAFLARLPVIMTMVKLAPSIKVRDGSSINQTRRKLKLFQQEGGFPKTVPTLYYKSHLQEARFL